MTDNVGEYFIEMGAFKYGGLSPDPVTEAYEMADKFYEPGREMTVWVYYDRWKDYRFVELPYDGPLNKGE